MVMLVSSFYFMILIEAYLQIIMTYMIFVPLSIHASNTRCWTQKDICKSNKFTTINVN